MIKFEARIKDVAMRLKLLVLVTRGTKMKRCLLMLHVEYISFSFLTKPV